MSRESLSAFRSKLAEDEALLGELVQTLGAGGRTRASVDELVAFAKAHGFDFAVDEACSSLELSDHELDGVAGGIGLGIAPDESRQQSRTTFDCSELVQWAVHQ
jgi:predicted ribosomally synthesized peptide with nif11-like leader